MDRFYQFFANKKKLLYAVIVLHIGLIGYLFVMEPVVSFSGNHSGLHLILLTILIVVMYLASLQNFSTNRLKCYTILPFLLYIIQFALNIERFSLKITLGALSTVILYVFMYSSMYIITLEQMQVFRELFQVTFGLVVTTIISYLFNSDWYASLSTFSFVFLNFLPVFTYLFYRREIKQIFIRQRFNLYIFAVWSIVSFTLIVGIFNAGHLSDLLIYSSNITVLLLLHLQVIIKKIYKRFTELKELYLKTVLKVGGIMIILLIALIFLLQLDFRSTYFLVNWLIIIFALCASQIIQIFEHKQFDREHFNTLFLKRHQIVQELLNDETQKDQFSEFLHNEILQNIIAIKNFNKNGNTPIFRNQIEEIASELIRIIRGRITYYQSNMDETKSLKENYESLIEKIVKNLYTNKSVNSQIAAELYLPSPYDSIIYRFIEELVTNAVKHATSDTIRLSLTVKTQTIQLIIENAMDEQANGKGGFGMKFIKNQVNALGGNMIVEQGRLFRVNITLTIDKELCYENFIN